MAAPRQDPIADIELALTALRREQRGRDRRAHHREHEGAHGHGHVHEPQAGKGGGHRGGPHLAGAARFRLLDALLSAEATGERLGISEIAEIIGVDQPRASRLVNDATERGLVRRRPDERDARRAVVEIADAGRATLETARANRRGAVTAAVAGFSPEETETFAALLSRFVTAWPRG